MVFKCKACGNDIELLGKNTVCECKYCHTEQKVPDDDDVNNELFQMVQLYLKEENWDNIYEYIEKILEVNPENAEAYWMKELAEKQCSNTEDLAEYYYVNECQDSIHLQYARRSADEKMKNKLEEFDSFIVEMPQRRKEKLAIAHQNNSIDSAAQELKKRLSRARKIADLVDSRVKTFMSVTVALDSNGKVIMTHPTYQSDSGETRGYREPIHEAQTWCNIEKIFSIEYPERIIGVSYDGDTYITPTRGLGSVFELDDDYCQGSKIVEIKKVKSFFEWEDRGDSAFLPESIGLRYLLKEDGEVLCVGEKHGDEPYHGENNTSKLKDIDKILQCGTQIICRKKDGRLVSTEFIENGGKCGPVVSREVWDEVSLWTNIRRLYRNYGSGIIVGLKEDGTVVVSRKDVSSEEFVFLDELRDWTDIVELFLFPDRVLGLTEYGEIITTRVRGADHYYDCVKEALKWKNVVKLYFKHGIMAALLVDGTVRICVHEGCQHACQFDIKQMTKEWKNIVGLNLSSHESIIGITQFGELRYAGENNYMRGNVESFKLFEDAYRLEQEIIENKLKSEQERSENELSYLETINEKNGLLRYLQETVIAEERRMVLANMVEKARRVIQSEKEKREKIINEVFCEVKPVKIRHDYVGLFDYEERRNPSRVVAFLLIVLSFFIAGSMMGDDVFLYLVLYLFVASVTGLIGCVPIGAVLNVLSCIGTNIITGMRNSKINRENERAMEIYQEHYNLYEREKREKIREFDTRIEKASKNADYLRGLEATAKSVCDKMYSVNILHAEYQKVDAVMRIYKYMSSGRCLSLYGPNGAYDTYEKEIRQDALIFADMQISKQLNMLTKEVRHGFSNIKSILGKSAFLMEEQNNNIQGLINKFDYGINLTGELIRDNYNLMSDISKIQQDQNRQMAASLKYMEFATKQSRLDAGKWS